MWIVFWSIFIVMMGLLLAVVVPEAKRSKKGKHRKR